MSLAESRNESEISRPEKKTWKNYKWIALSHYIALCRQEATNGEATAAKILSHSRNTFAVNARWRIWEHLWDRGYSYSQIGRVSGFDHTSVRWGVMRLKAWRSEPVGNLEGPCRGLGMRRSVAVETNEAPTLALSRPQSGVSNGKST